MVPNLRYINLCDCDTSRRVRLRLTTPFESIITCKAITGPLAGEYVEPEMILFWKYCLKIIEDVRFIGLLFRY